MLNKELNIKRLARSETVTSLKRCAIFLASIILVTVAITVVNILHNRHIYTTRIAYEQAEEARIKQSAQDQVDQSNISRVRIGSLPGATEDPSITMQPLGNQLETYMKEHAPGGSAYIESLNKHVMVNVGRTKAYNTKSLMKAPLAMTLYKAAEENRLDLDATRTITQDELDPHYGNLYLAGAGASITLRKAAAIALEQSDNTAIHVVNDAAFPVMPHDERAYIALNLDLQTDSNQQTFTTARSYATVFRCLYTACYNNRQNSDELLSMMEKSDFSDPGNLLPKNTVVSHKIGDNGDQGFNDCGIVFGPKDPYIFCIMLDKGAASSAQDIAQIVKQSYDFLEK